MNCNLGVYWALRCRNNSHNDKYCTKPPLKPIWINIYVHIIYKIEWNVNFNWNAFLKMCFRTLFLSSHPAYKLRHYNCGIYILFASLYTMLYLFVFNFIVFVFMYRYNTNFLRWHTTFISAFSINFYARNRQKTTTYAHYSSMYCTVYSVHTKTQK